MERDDCIELGYIAKAHGIQGEVKVQFDVDDLKDYRKRKQFYVAKKGNPLLPYTATKFHPIEHGQEVIMRFTEITDRNVAEAHIGAQLFMPASELPVLREGRFYYFEVIGFTIEDENKGTLGTITAVLDMPAQDLIEMEYEGKQVYIPITDAFVLKADKVAKKVHTRMPEGLLEMYLGVEEEQE